MATKPQRQFEQYSKQEWGTGSNQEQEKTRIRTALGGGGEAHSVPVPSRRTVSGEGGKSLAPTSHFSVQNLLLSTEKCTCGGTRNIPRGKARTIPNVRTIRKGP